MSRIFIRFSVFAESAHHRANTVTRSPLHRKRHRTPGRQGLAFQSRPTSPHHEKRPGGQNG